MQFTMPPGSVGALQIISGYEDFNDQTEVLDMLRGAFGLREDCAKRCFGRPRFFAEKKRLATPRRRTRLENLVLGKSPFRDAPPGMPPCCKTIPHISGQTQLVARPEPAPSVRADNFALF